jgi:hypothetical protein
MLSGASVRRVYLITLSAYTVIHVEAAGVGPQQISIRVFVLVSLLHAIGTMVMQSM